MTIPTGPDRSFLVRLLKSSSNWTKLSMSGPQLFSGWYPMILDVFRCSQLLSDVFSWVVTFMHNQPLCGHFVELSLFSGESLAGPACFCWKSNWTKIDHLGSTGGHWETISGSFLVLFGSGLEPWRFQVSMRPIFPSTRHTINEEDKFYSILMIVI